jgi:hypothetical protein
MKQYTIFYHGSASKKNPLNLVNYFSDLFTGTKKDARKYAAERKQFLKKNDLVTGRIRVEIC